MNIFVLDYDFDLCAQYHVDKHVVKMITEANQLLSSAYYFDSQGNFRLPSITGIYKLSHRNHPCSLWARESLANWLWLKGYCLSLCREYTYRYGKVHAGEIICSNMLTPRINDIGLTSHPQCMPEKYCASDVVEAYRAYYIGEKQKLFKWTNRDKPYWIET